MLPLPLLLPLPLSVGDTPRAIGGLVALAHNDELLWLAPPGDALDDDTERAARGDGDVAAK